jgi:hypothetical protein
MTAFILCDWYTPDYRQYHDQLAKDTAEREIPHDSIATANLPGSITWESRTCRKPLFVLDFLRRNDPATILLVDSDCRVLGTREQLERVCDIGDGDIALHLTGRVSRSGSVKIHPWSGTMVFRNTDRTVRLLNNWVDETTRLTKYGTDEGALAVAICRTPGLRVCVLDPRACAPSITSDSIIAHPSMTGKRSSRWRKTLARYSRLYL